MLSFDDILNLKRKIYETAWTTFTFLIKHRIDPTPENYKKFYEKFFQEEKTFDNPLKRIFKKTEKVLGKTSYSLEEVAQTLQNLKKNPALNKFINKIVERLEREKGSLEKLREEIKKFERELEAVSRDRYVDPLTGVWNRLALQEFLENLPSLEMERDIVVAFIDLNRFKYINDTYGHLAGDKVLKHFATFMQINLKRKDFFARFGGDEFVAVLFDIDLEDAKKFFEKLRKEIPPVKVNGKEIKVDFCVGLTVPFGNDKPEDIIARADAAMYKCKKSGKIEIALK